MADLHNESVVERAQALALRAHANQKYADHPYQYHLERVVKAVEEFGSKEFHSTQLTTLKAAAWLHDALEDTSLTKEEVEKVVGREVADLAELVTDEPGKDRAERKGKTLIKTRTRPDAVFLKLCDRLANVRSSRSENPNPRLLEMYRSEQPTFRQLLKKENEFVELWDALEQQLS